MSLRLAVACASLCLVVTAVGAAQSATVNHFSYVRSGPSAGYPSVNHVMAGAKVRVIECVLTRCKIDIPGPDGWIRKSYLDF